ncbi:MAG: hypothetical protein IIC02_07460, partial [Planctomycetes bacterium]|nr:hypothetical protein [Planctomycetota bacterium]
GMGPGAPGFARGHPIADTGKLALIHATHHIAASHQVIDVLFDTGLRCAYPLRRIPVGG